MFETEIRILALLLVAAFVGMAARRLKLPYTLALVATGIGLGFFHLEGLSGFRLTPELLLSLFLPALLFEAAYHVNLKSFWKDAPLILLLAIPGVMLAVAATGFLTWWLLNLANLPHFDLEHGILFAAMIAATDPISVLALFRSLGVNKRLYLLVEGESLFNDGIAVVIFVIVTAVLGISGGHGGGAALHGGLGELAIFSIKTFVWMAVGGAVIGGTIGLLASVVTRQVDDRLLEITITVIVAYSSYLLAEQFHTSGVLSCVIAGIVLGSFGSQFGMSALTRIAVMDFWEFMAFFSNTFVFLLVGLELDVPALWSVGGFIALAFLAVIAGRAAVIYTLVPLGKLFSIRPIPRAWPHVLVWGGLRGSLSMVLVMSLPADYPGRKVLLLLVFGVVSLSLLGQGLTIKPFLRKLGVVVQREVEFQYEEARARALMARQALAELKSQSRSGLVDAGLRKRLDDWYMAGLERNEATAAELAGTHLDAERLQEAALHLLSVEEETLRHVHSEGVVASEVAEQLMSDLAQRRELLLHSSHAEDFTEELESLFRVDPSDSGPEAATSENDVAEEA